MSENALVGAWRPEEKPETVIVEFALAHIFMWPLATGKSDPFVGLIGALCDLEQDEVGVYQAA